MGQLQNKSRKNPRLSIITINLNDEEGLKKTFKSVREQSFQDFEHIVIDGKSNDGSLDFLKNNSKYFSYWESNKDKGIYNAQNKGIKNAKGDYILFLNSGDFLFNKDSLENIFQYNPTEDIFYGDVMLEKNNRYRKKIFQSKVDLFLLLEDMICHQVQFIKRALFEEIGYYDESLKVCSDYEFLIRAIIGKNKMIKHYPVVTAIHNMTGVSMSEMANKLVPIERELVKKRYFPDFVIEQYKSEIALKLKTKIKRRIGLFYNRF